MVIDTNVIIRAARGKSPISKIIDNWLEEKFQLLISNSILLEYEVVLHYPKFNYPHYTIANFLYAILTRAVQISPKRLHNVIVEDPEDNKFIDCAVEGKADYIVSGDPHLLALKEYLGTKIITSKKFLKLLK